MDILYTSPCAESAASNCSMTPTEFLLVRSFSYTVDVIALLSFVLLTVYLIRSRHENTAIAHSLLFWQFYLISTIILLLRSVSRIFVVFYKDRHMGLENETADKMLLFYGHFVFTLFIRSTSGFLITLVLMISFTAAVQRLVLTYRPKFSFLLIGKPLYVIILFNWLLSFLYFYLTKDPRKLKFPLFTFNDSPLILIFQLIFLSVTLSSSAIYLHFYRLIATFTDQYQFHRIHLLWQFLPIHIVLIVSKLLQFGLDFAIQLNMSPDVLERVDGTVEDVVTPLIPTVISLSYILSRENIRSVLLTVLGPIWVDISN